MPRLFRSLLLIAFAGLVAACQTGPSATESGGVTPGAVAGDPIEVTALDAPGAAPAPAGASSAAAPVALPEAPEQDAIPLPGASDTEAAPPAPIPTTPDATAETAEPAVEAEPAPVPKSERQVACERKRGNWVVTDAGLGICTLPTSDGGKRCTRESQCDGVCLARSGTCAPADPLLGCNEVLQDNGARATLCIE